ncbi:uncharacterized protein METZ01_LOCUS68440 [marine metagenome]|uniref:Uncharacterized protein n=1 Tax=marine metagenome TaxID=408172 RepID=A0A381THI6_9ZZZZ
MEGIAIKKKPFTEICAISSTDVFRPRFVTTYPQFWIPILAHPADVQLSITRGARRIG